MAGASRGGYRRMKRSYGAGEMSRPPALSVSPRLESRRKEVPEAIPKAAQKFPWRMGPDRKVRRRRVGMDITWVTDRIAVGGGIWNADNMAAVSRAGITHIIDMQIEFDEVYVRSVEKFLNGRG